MNFSISIGFLVFRIFLPLTILIIQFVLYRRAIRWLKEGYPARKSLRYVVSGVFLVFNAAFLYVAITRPVIVEMSDWFRYAGAYPFYIWFAATFFIGLGIFVGTILKTPVKLGWWLARRLPASREKVANVTSTPSFQRFNASRREFLRRGMYGLTAVSFAGSSYGILFGKDDYEVIETEFRVRRLSPHLDGFTIALISDVHSSMYMTKDDMDEYARVVNSLGTDLIVVPGDFVNSMVREVYPFAEAFSTLRAPYGVYGVMGNHDFYNTNPELVAKEVDDCGIKLLRNDKVIVEKNGGKFYLLGVDDVGRANRSRIKLDESIGHAPLPIPKILLCHRPYYLKEAASKNIDLILSGHTHGGQVVLGTLGQTILAPASLASPYVWGKYQLENTEMYVTRGIGTVGLPLRLNCPPEITKITLRVS